MIRRRSIFGFLFTAALPLRAFANEQTAVSSIDSFHRALLEGMKSGKQVSFAQRFKTLSSAVDQTFDLSTILSASVGSAWNRFLPDEQKNLTETFRRYTISSYVANFDEYSGQNFVCLPDIRQLDDDKIVVQSRMQSVGDTIIIDYVLKQNSGWKVIDVLLAGSISRVAVQRSDFRHLIADGGAAALISQLDTKTSEMSGGTNLVVR